MKKRIIRLTIDFDDPGHELQITTLAAQFYEQNWLSQQISNQIRTSWRVRSIETIEVEP